MDVLQDIAGAIKPYLKDVDRFIEERLATNISLLKKVQKHILASNGKRIRPVLHLLSSLTLGEVRHENIVVAAISEFIHTATLLHDDVIDNSPTRRGRPTVNTIWGNQLSVMVGDFFYTISMNSLLQISNVDVMRTFSRATQEMSEGEIIQHENLQNSGISLEKYLDIIRRKTAVLFSACCESAAILAGLPPADCRKWADFGENLGMAFQLVDDLLDYTGTEHETGKTPYTDLSESKLTLPLLHALLYSSKKEKKRIEAILNIQDKSDAEISEVLHIIRQSGGLEATRDRAAEYQQRAAASIETFESSRYHSYLINLSDYVLKRSR